MRYSEEVFGEKYRLYGPMLYRLAMVYLANPADCEDVLQEVFLALFTKSPSFTSAEHEKAWLLRVTHNRCKNKRKSPARKNLPLDPAFLGAQNGPDLALAQAILALKPSYKIVLHLHYFEGYSVKELASLLRLSQSAVKMRLKRAREQLKLEWEET